MMVAEGAINSWAFMFVCLFRDGMGLLQFLGFYGFFLGIEWKLLMLYLRQTTYIGII